MFKAHLQRVMPCRGFDPEPNLTGAAASLR